MTHLLLLITAEGLRTEHPATEGTELGIMRRHLGQLDIGISSPWQFAVAEWSADSAPFNPAASEMLGRRIFGDCFVWGVGPGGASTSWNSDTGF